MIVGAFVIAAIFTPPDVLSQLLLALPLVILFQAGIWLVKFFGKSQAEIDGMPKDDEDEE